MLSSLFCFVVCGRKVLYFSLCQESLIRCVFFWIRLRWFLLGCCWDSNFLNWLVLLHVRIATCRFTFGLNFYVSFLQLSSLLLFPFPFNALYPFSKRKLEFYRSSVTIEIFHSIEVVIRILNLSLHHFS